MRLPMMLIVVFGVMAGAAVALSVLGTDPGVCETYHEMREIYENTGGSYGWPEGAVRGCDYE